MLTSHHYLIGSLFAVFCAIGTAPGDATSQSVGNMNAQHSLPAAFIEPTETNALQGESADVVYRGSGRLNDEPIHEERGKSRATIAHRGSGRVAPVPM